MSLHRMEFQGPRAFTHQSFSGRTIRVRLSGGWDCAMTSREVGENTTIHGLVVIGGDTSIEADRVAIS